MHSSDDLPVYGTNVRDMGACGDGAGDDGPALQRALDKGGVVVIPYGIYKTANTLRIGSGTHVCVHPHARIIFADGAGRCDRDFLVTNANHATGNENIIVEGGIWDGNNRGNPRGPDSPGSYTGVMINFSNVKNLTLSNMTLTDPTSYFMRLIETRRFRVEDITLRLNHIRPNQDGIHVAGLCEDGIIRRIKAQGDSTPNDDMIALLSDDAASRAQNLGIKNGPIRRIFISEITADDCYSFLRLLSVVNPIEEIEVDGVYGGCRVCAVNMDAARKCLVPLFDASDHRFSQGDGMKAAAGYINKVICSRRLKCQSVHQIQPQYRFQLRNLGLKFGKENSKVEANTFPIAPALLEAGAP